MSLCVFVCVSTVSVFVSHFERERERGNHNLWTTAALRINANRKGAAPILQWWPTTQLEVCVPDPVVLAHVNRRPSGMQAWFISQQEGALSLFSTEIAFWVQILHLCRGFDVQCVYHLEHSCEKHENVPTYNGKRCILTTVDSSAVIVRVPHRCCFQHLF